jgi:hypothetical protein
LPHAAGLMYGNCNVSINAILAPLGVTPDAAAISQ